MRFQEIQKMAKGMGINTYKMKKADIIRMIQRKENNLDCYATDRVDHCEEEDCSWRLDCVASNKNRQADPK